MNVAPSLSEVATRPNTPVWFQRLLPGERNKTQYAVPEVSAVGDIVAVASGTRPGNGPVAFVEPVESSVPTLLPMSLYSSTLTLVLPPLLLSANSMVVSVPPPFAVNWLPGAKTLPKAGPTARALLVAKALFAPKVLKMTAALAVPGAEIRARATPHRPRNGLAPGTATFSRLRTGTGSGPGGRRPPSQPRPGSSPGSDSRATRCARPA